MEISPAAAPLEALFQLGEADYKAFRVLASTGKGTNSTRRIVLSLLALFALILVASFVFHRALASRAIAPRADTSGTPNLTTVMLLLASVIFYLVVWGVLVINNKKSRAANPNFAEPTLLALDESALTRRCGAFFIRVEWNGIARVIASETHLILMTSPIEGFIAPRRAFDREADWQRFVDFARQQWQRAQPAVPPIANV